MFHCNQLNLLLLICTFSISLNAQERWGSYETSFAGSRFQLIETCYDTVAISSNQFVERLNITSAFSGVDLGREVVGDSVFLSRIITNEAPKLLYDFSLIEGDTFDTSWGDMMVTEVSTVIVFGEDRKRFELVSVPHNNFEYKDIWIEGIGSTKNGYLGPGTPDAIIDAGSGFSCYYSAVYDEWYYGDNDPLLCLADSINSGCFSTSIPEINTVRASIYPNPAMDYITIELDENSHFQIEELSIYNPMGRLMYKETDPALLQAIDVSNLASGHYIIELSMSGNQQYLSFIKTF